MRISPCRTLFAPRGGMLRTCFRPLRSERGEAGGPSSFFCQDILGSFLLFRLFCFAMSSPPLAGWCVQERLKKTIMCFHVPISFSFAFSSYSALRWRGSGSVVCPGGTEGDDHVPKPLGIVKSRLKIRTAIANAKLFLVVRKEFGSYSPVVLSRRKTGCRYFRSLAGIPVSSPEAEAMSWDMRRRGFKFFGATICYAFLQASGFPPPGGLYLPKGEPKEESVYRRVEPGAGAALKGCIGKRMKIAVSRLGLSRTEIRSLRDVRGRARVVEGPGPYVRHFDTVRRGDRGRNAFMLRMAR